MKYCLTVYIRFELLSKTDAFFCQRGRNVESLILRILPWLILYNVKEQPCRSKYYNCH